MSKHTPGPWLIKEYGRSTSDNEYDHSEIHIGRRIGSFEVKVITDRPITSMREVAINAALIAAAPDLLEAALQVMAWWEEHQYDTCGEYGEYNTYEDEPEFVKSARSAIAKARGEA